MYEKNQMEDQELEFDIQDFFENPSEETCLKILEKTKGNIRLKIIEYFLNIFNFSKDILEYKAIAEYDLGYFEKSKQTLDYILDNFSLNEKEKEKLWQIYKIVIPNVRNSYDFYNQEIIDKILSKKSKNIITFTITTCKRLSLFVKTMNSFLNCCEDLDKIDNWLCVDDNSSEEDRNEMKRLYPFFNFYFKDISEKGHYKSMNIIRNKIKTPFILHMEDDWLFFRRKKYVSECLEILLSQTNIYQCLINRNYAETEKDDSIYGGYKKETKNGISYVLHEHYETEEDKKLFYEKYSGKNTCGYWPYFSFRPSLFKTSIFKDIGEFRNVVHFELEYSNRYKNLGYKSAFMNGIYCLHTGRLTSERNDTTKLNSYDLNNEEQFETEISKTFVINLENRKDRWQKFLKNKENLKEINFERFNAINGNSLIPTEQLQRIFDNNDYNMRAGMVGCAMSHIYLYIQLVKSKQKYYLILEDDIELCKNFKTKLDYILKNIDKNWDICYLTHHIKKQFITERTFSSEEFPKVTRKKAQESLKFSYGGTAGYLISKKGARLLLEYINKYGMTNGIDTVQQKSADILNVYYTDVHLIKTECYIFDKNADTDIQNNFTSLTIPIETRIEKEKEFNQDLIEINLNQDLTRDLTRELNQDLTREKCFLLRNDNESKFQEILNKLKHDKYNHYQLGNNHIMVVSEKLKDYYSNNGRYFERLKINNSYDIKDCLKFKKVNLVCFGNMNHVYEAVNNQKELFFDRIENGSFEVFFQISKRLIENKPETFLDEFFNITENETYIQQYNQKQIFKNKKYNLIFPHDDISKLREIYLNRMNNFIEVIENKDEILFINCSRWEKINDEIIKDFLDFFQNAKLFLINSLKENSIFRSHDRIIYKEIDFPEHLRIEEWTNEKTEYDQKIFRNTLIQVIKEIQNN
jgi:GR25 family glycosyltransferase involved in LPS biosynthesis